MGVLRHGSNVTAMSVPRSNQRTGGRHRTQPVFSIDSHASMALCLSIRLRVCGSSDLHEREVITNENVTSTVYACSKKILQ